MKTIRIPNDYLFEYDTLLSENKLINYKAWSLGEAIAKLRKNTKCVKILDVTENGRSLRKLGVSFG